MGDNNKSYNVRRSLNKKELAEQLGVTSRTLRIWLNERYYNDLVKLGYKKHDKVLNPRVLCYLFDKLDLN
jgi:hypothetical protein